MMTPACPRLLDMINAIEVILYYYIIIILLYAPTTSHSDEETDNFYNTIDTILEKQAHYTVALGDFNAKVGGQSNTSEMATGCFGLGQRNERGD